MRVETRAKLIALPVGIAIGLLIVWLGVAGLVVAVLLYGAWFGWCAFVSLREAAVIGVVRAA